ncbi:hypothetical protein [Methylotenera sp.]|uniref:hypothetical protein n=1 Tax=Methylotenera sp. TaxID=2051956 RepID=UPI00248A3D0B|nr:hypothetical protein [Methylotenera sp.]MDI1361335.1 hypothetical protein [Methylotenera sp.]
MNNPTFKAIEHKVNLALCLVALVVTIGLTFSNLATAKSMTDNEYKLLENNIATKFNAAKSRCATVTSTAFNQCVAAAESIRNTSKIELDTQRKVVAGDKHESTSSANTAKLESHKNVKARNTNTMPVMDELTTAFKKTRLI